MDQRSPGRKALTVLAVLAFAGVSLWLVTKPRVMSGTKTFFTTAPIKTAPPGGSAPANTKATTTTAISAGNTTARP